MRIVKHNDRISLESLYNKEKFIADRLMEMLKIKPEKPNKIDVEGLQDDQIEAMNKAIESQVFILTGVPGSGKTYLIKKLISLFQEDEVGLVAPTGKASKKMAEMSGMEAKTIHSLLEPQMEGNKFIFTRNENYPLDETAIIVDETSMVNINLMYSLLKALKPETRLIFVGDNYQLAPIGPGLLLRDMITSNKIPCAELITIKRQNPGLIITNCHRIKNGKNIQVENRSGSDFFFLERETPEEIKETILDLIINRLPKKFPIDPKKDIQLITSYREKTNLSCKSFNIALQELLNSNKKIDKVKFKVGDKIINGKNQYELNILNGDIGYIKSIDIEDRKIIVDFTYPDREIELNLYDNNLMLAYAITVHRFQGSESPIIIIPIHSCMGTFLIQRNWLYTAISRSQKLCLVVGQREEIPKIIARNKEQKRYTNLENFL